MNLTHYLKFRTILLFVLVPILLISNINESQARKKRTKYNPKATRAQAIDIIRTSSEKISELAGLEPVFTDSTSNIISNIDDSEEFEGEYGEDIIELESEDDVTVDIETFKSLWLSYVDEDDETTIAGIRKQDVMDRIMNWLGTPYRFGGTSNKAIDCSAWTRTVFAETAKIMLPRTAREQCQVGKQIKRKNLEFGDLIFFHTYSRRFASHVGIYLGDNLFAHASSRFGVTVSSLESTYYKNRFIGGRRLSERDLVQFSINKKISDDLEQ